MHDLLAHLIGWQLTVGDGVAAIQAGTALSQFGGDDTINAGFVAARATLAWPLLLEQLDERCATRLAAARALNVEQWQHAWLVPTLRATTFRAL